MNDRDLSPRQESHRADLLYAATGAAAFTLACLAAPLLYWRGFGPGLSQRLGFLPGDVDHLSERPVWLHAASVGETLSAASFVACLRQRLPGVPLVTSSTTLTGRARAREQLRPEVSTLLPIDALHIIDRALREVRPRCIILVETEIWPGLLRAASALSIPVAIISGRLSERSTSCYRRASSLFRASLRRVSVFAMQTAGDAERIVSLGAPAERVYVTGSLKEVIPVTPPAPTSLRGIEKRPILIAASTHPGEEEFVLEACAGFWTAFPDLLVVLAPRRPERFDEVARIVVDSGLISERRSNLRDDSVREETRVLVLDTIGELVGLFPFARGVFVGGTIAPIGGHNVLEPAVAGTAVAFGPNVENVREAAERLIQAEGARSVASPDDLGRLWWRLLTHPEVARQMGMRARGAVGRGADALEHTWKLVAPLLT